MEAKSTPVETHPVGECKSTSFGDQRAWPVDTPGGRYYAEWDTGAPVTREGQLIFFFQFLHTGGRWKEFLARCPLKYTGNRGSGAAKVFGTVLLSVLSGHWRYAHINAVRGDGVNPGLLGIDGTVSEDVVRQAMMRISETQGLEWLNQQVVWSIAPALKLPWILDIDVTVKPLYGHQQGAELGYNPHKPGRPCHMYHSYFVANLRISLGVEVRAGKEQAASHGLPGMWRTLERLPRENWPTFVRGDCGNGNEAVMRECEERSMPYLFKLRHTARVKELVQAMMRKGAGWQDCGDGWQAMECELKLSGWTRSRRVILVRETSAQAPLRLENGKKRRGKDRQSLFANGDAEGWRAQATPWSGKISVVVTSLDERAFSTQAIPRQYRERADAENSFDELKNQWGWGGFTSRRLGPSRLMANLVALFYNWWNLYVRFFDEERHREAIRSRPMLMQGVGRQVQSGGQRTVKVSIVHEKGEMIASAVAAVSKELHHIRCITERWSTSECWALLLTRILRRWLGGKWLFGVPEDARLLLSG